MERKVNNVSAEERLALERLSAATLPDSPTQSGMKPAMIRAAFWQALTKGKGSVAGLLDRVVSEMNDALGNSIGREELGNTMDAVDAALGRLKKVSLQVEHTWDEDPSVQVSEDGEQLALTFFLPRAKGLGIVKTYGSVKEMDLAWKSDGVPLGGIVMIDTSPDTNKEENAELYAKGEDGYYRIGDISGAQGIQGERGPKGECSVRVAGNENPVWYNSNYTSNKFYFKVAQYQSGQSHLSVNLDFRIIAGGVGFRFPCNLTRPYNAGQTRIIFAPSRVIFEEEENKSRITYFRVYEYPVEGTGEYALWVEIQTDGCPVEAAYLNANVTGGELYDVCMEAYDLRDASLAESKPSDCDSLTVKTADWSNKTSVLNIDSRATAPGATVGGTGNRVEAKNAASFGENGKIESDGTGSVQGGNGNINRAKNVAQVGENLVNDTGGHNSAQFGSNHYNNGANTIQSGIKCTNNGSDVAQFGHTMTNDGDHVFQHGWECHNDKSEGGGYNYVDMVGKYLWATRVCQQVRGQYNVKDSRAAAIWANGTENNPKNIFTIAASGTPELPTDGVTLGYLMNTFKAQLEQEILGGKLAKVTVYYPFSQNTVRLYGGFVPDTYASPDYYAFYVNGNFEEIYKPQHGGIDEDVDMTLLLDKYGDFMLGVVAHKAGYASSEMSECHIYRS